MPGIADFAPLWGVWNIVRTLGSGTFGDVYEVKRTDTGREYSAAVKHIPIPPKGTSYQSLKAEGSVTDFASAGLYCKGLLDTLTKEIDICYELKGHTNFVSYEDHMIVPRKGDIGFDVFIRMELLTPLPDYVSDKGVSVGGITKLCEDMCTALAVLEQKRIIHRDIKPANIFVSASGDFKLGDFGVARHMEGVGSMSVKGTYNFMAPEILKGGAVGHNSDIYSLGLVLYRLLNNNRAPFLPPPPAPISYEDNEAALEKRLSGALLPPPERAALSLPLTNVIMRACEYEPSKRFRTAEEMKRALADFRAAAAQSSASARFDPDATVAVERDAAFAGRRLPDSPASGFGSYPGFGGASAYPSGPGFPVGGGGAGRGRAPSNKAPAAALISAAGVVVVALVVILVLFLPNRKPSLPDVGASAVTASPASQPQTPSPKSTASPAPKPTPEPTASPAPEPTPGPTPEPAPVIGPAAFDRVYDIISGKDISVSVAETATGFLHSARGGETKAISALANVPILYSVIRCIDNGYLNPDSTISYVNSGGRGATGRLSGKNTGSAVSVTDLIYDMLIYSSNSATNTFIEYFKSAPAGSLNTICADYGYDSVDIQNRLGVGDNYACADHIAGMLEELWATNRDMLLDYFRITSSDSLANIGMLRDVPSSGALNHNGVKDGVYSEAFIFFDPQNTDKAYITVFLGNGSNQSELLSAAAGVGSRIYNSVNAASGAAPNYAGAMFYPESRIGTRNSLSGPDTAFTDQTDDCFVVSVGHYHNGTEYWLIDFPVTIPTPNGRMRAYALKRSITAGGFDPYESTCRRESVVYRNSDLNTAFGSVAGGEKFFVLDDNGFAVQIIYSSAGGESRIGWVEKSALRT